MHNLCFWKKLSILFTHVNCILSTNSCGKKCGSCKNHNEFLASTLTTTTTKCTDKRDYETWALIKYCFKITQTLPDYIFNKNKCNLTWKVLLKGHLAKDICVFNPRPTPLILWITVVKDYGFKTPNVILPIFVIKLASTSLIIPIVY